MDGQGRKAPIGGVMLHVGAAEIRRADGARIEGFSRGVGRNRVAVAVDVPLSPGEIVGFDVAIDGGHMAGEGRVERIHVERGADGAIERWIVVDVDRLSSDSTARLVRMLRHDHAPHAVLAEPPRRPDVEPPKPRLRSAPPPPPSRGRLRVRKPRERELPDRWRVRPPGQDD